MSLLAFMRIETRGLLSSQNSCHPRFLVDTELRLSFLGTKRSAKVHILSFQIPLK
jgi:hypothetical protein